MTKTVDLPRPRDLDSLRAPLTESCMSWRAKIAEWRKA